MNRSRNLGVMTAFIVAARASADLCSPSRDTELSTGSGHEFLAPRRFLEAMIERSSTRLMH